MLGQLTGQTPTVLVGVVFDQSRNLYPVRRAGNDCAFVHLFILTCQGLGLQDIWLSVGKSCQTLN